jgi:hypothetical protein
MPYSESTFLCFALMAFLGMAKRWHPLLIAFVIGLATASRPVGVALLLPFGWRLWKDCVSPLQRVQVAGYVLFALWGLMAYVAYQKWEFDDGVAFARTQQHWSTRTSVSTGDKLLSLGSLEPIWTVYVGDTSHWMRDSTPVFSLEFLNPIYFLLAVGCVAWGAWRKALTMEETLFAAGVLLIPYLTKGYEWGMLSHARFAAVAFPIYIVMGQALAALPRPVASALVAISGFFMASYATLFALGRAFF